MAFLTSKEQYWRFKPFAELVVPFGVGDSNLKLEIEKGYVYDEGDTLDLLLVLSDNPDKNKGFKQDGKTQIQWAVTNTNQRKIFGKDAVVARLEKYCHQYFKQYAGKYIRGDIYVSFDMAFERYEKGLDSALEMCFEAHISECDKQFDIPQVAASSGGANKNYAPKETEPERLKAKLDFILTANGDTYSYWGEDKYPSLCEFVVAFQSLMKPDEVRMHAFSLWLTMNLAGSPCKIEDIETAIKYLQG